MPDGPTQHRRHCCLSEAGQALPISASLSVDKGFSCFCAHFCEFYFHTKKRELYKRRASLRGDCRLTLCFLNISGTNIIVGDSLWLSSKREGEKKRSKFMHSKTKAERSQKKPAFVLLLVTSDELKNGGLAIHCWPRRPRGPCPPPLPCLHRSRPRCNCACHHLADP